MGRDFTRYQNIKQTRVPHMCNCCKRIIPLGSEALKIVCKISEADHPFTHYHCIACYNHERTAPELAFLEYKTGGETYDYGLSLENNIQQPVSCFFCQCEIPTGGSVVRYTSLYYVKLTQCLSCYSFLRENNDYIANEQPEIYRKQLVNRYY